MRQTLMQGLGIMVCVLQVGSVALKCHLIRFSPQVTAINEIDLDSIAASPSS